MFVKIGTNIIFAKNCLTKKSKEMTRQEVKSLIDAKIAGQGNQVDAGGVLDIVLKSIIDIIPKGVTTIIGQFSSNSFTPQSVDNTGRYVAEELLNGKSVILSDGTARSVLVLESGQLNIKSGAFVRVMIQGSIVRILLSNWGWQD